MGQKLPKVGSEVIMIARNPRKLVRQYKARVKTLLRCIEFELSAFSVQMLCRSKKLEILEENSFQLRPQLLYSAPEVTSHT